MSSDHELVHAVCSFVLVGAQARRGQSEGSYRRTSFLHEMQRQGVSQVQGDAAASTSSFKGRGRAGWTEVVKQVVDERSGAWSGGTREAHATHSLRHSASGRAGSSLAPAARSERFLIKEAVWCVSGSMIDDLASLPLIAAHGKSRDRLLTRRARDGEPAQPPGPPRVGTHTPMVLRLPLVEKRPPLT